MPRVKKLNAADQWIVSFLSGKNWTSPTSIGKAYGAAHNKKDIHSAWASPKCKKLVELGFLDRSENGHYRLKNQTEGNSMWVSTGFFIDDNGNIVDIATLSEKGLYAVTEPNAKFPGILVCVDGGERCGEVVGEYSYYNDLFEIKLVLHGFVMKRYEGQDGLFFDKVVKHEKDGSVRFDIVEYCSLQTKVDSKVAEHRGKLQIAYGYTFDPGEEYNEPEIMRTGKIGDLEDYRSMIDPESEEGRKLLEYAGVKE